MRLLIEIILVAALIALAWTKSFQERVSELPWIGGKIAPNTKTSAQPQQAPRSRPQIRSVVTPAPTASGAWMWDATRKSPLDPPHKSPTPH